MEKRHSKRWEFIQQLSFFKWMDKLFHPLRNIPVPDFNVENDETIS
jgi:hypothetical protein